ncbi:MAG: tryptophan--tRNA ligase [Chloroflexi bacterium]|nr:tryptophan--tRNA ligase [Chloroflexota bacterium]
MRRAFSGARPTGKQHIGNYIGAIQNYVKLQDEFECYYCVVDLHALMSLNRAESMRENTYEMVLDWLAAGLDPNRCTILLQSRVPEVSELHLVLSMVTPMGWLTRVPTFKEKVRQQPDNVNYGLLGYPVLMTADIILYKADTVPVGEDQLPHLEMAREVVRRFNTTFGETFPEPFATLTSFPRVMGIDGAQKMGKSLNNHIELSATPAETEKRVRSMVTDPARVYRTDPGHPEVCNVFSFHKFYSPWEVDEIAEACRTAQIGCVDCKKKLAKNLNLALEPFRERRAAFAANPNTVWEILSDGSERARQVARQTIAEVRDKVGLC